MTVGWFSAQLRFRSKICDASCHDPLCEESIRLIEAETETVAWAKAAALGQASEHTYENDQGELVQWVFVRVVEVQDLCEDEIKDGVEVFSRLRWSSAEGD